MHSKKLYAKYLFYYLLNSFFKIPSSVHIALQKNTENKSLL